MLNEFNSYDHQFFGDNVYGCALSLLKRNKASQRDKKENDIHLDIGCGYARIAEHITTDLDRQYVGLDGDSIAVDAVIARGFEAHHALLTDADSCLKLFRDVIGTRTVASISILDVLEHLPNGDDVLNALRTIAQDHSAVLVISVPNVAHRDIGFRLAFGEWDYTREGLLDHTHTRLFNKKFFTRILQYNGFHPIDEENVILPKSDQHFPETHPALAPHSSLHDLLSFYRDGVDNTANVNQFVFCCAAGARIGDYPFREKTHNEGGPFLSIIMRTQGTRPHTMIEAFTSLAAQTCQDFEVLVIGHKLSLTNQKSVERIIEDNPAWLREKTRLLKLGEGNRTRPLNFGFKRAKGDYIAILDDDDVPFAHWVETFKDLARKGGGRVLRTVAAKQDILSVDIENQRGIRAISGLKPYPAEFDLFDHLQENFTPPVSLAFPRGVFHDLGITFDEELTTTEDWDFMMRSIFVAGIENSPEITAIYHWWSDSEQSSRSDHPQEEWISNHQAILRKMDAMPIILPPNSVSRLRKKLDKINSRTYPIYEASESLLRVVSILDSTSWKMAYPLRAAKYLFTRKRSPGFTDIIQLSDVQLDDLAGRLYSSWSWRLTSPLRFFARLV